MKISFNVHLYVGLVVTVASAVATGILPLENAIPDSWIPHVKAWEAIIAFGGGVYLTALSQSTSSPSPPTVSK